MELTSSKLAQMIDHTELKPDASPNRIRELCQEAIDYGFGAVCVNSCNVMLASDELAETNVNVCSVVGFPLGAMMTEAKAFEAECAVSNGAHEIDMVMNIGAMKAGDEELVEEDIAAVVEASNGKPVKVILETGFLTEGEITAACQLAEGAGAAFVKTSTGFGPRGASIEDVEIMNDAIGGRLGIKAAGGIHTYDEAKAMVDAGATRIGASRGIQIISGAED